MRAASLSDEISHVVVSFLCGDRDHALMAGGPRQTGELVARHSTNGNTFRPANVNQLLNALVAASRRHGNIFKAATARRHPLFHRVTSKDAGHGLMTGPSNN